MLYLLPVTRQPKCTSFMDRMVCLKQRLTVTLLVHSSRMGKCGLWWTKWVKTNTLVATFNDHSA